MNILFFNSIENKRPFTSKWSFWCKSDDGWPTITSTILPDDEDSHSDSSVDSIDINTPSTRNIPTIEPQGKHL